MRACTAVPMSVATSAPRQLVRILLRVAVIRRELTRRIDEGNVSRTYQHAERQIARWLPPTLRRVLTVFADSGAAAFLVGGSVRDAFLDRPASDWDIATDRTPREVGRLFDRVYATGERHGTVTVVEDEIPIEVTTFRREGPYLDGRRPSNEEFTSSIEDDLGRRDFTMNALAFDPLEAKWADPFDGARDIEASVIRCVGDALKRFREDGLRPMRAIRFVSTLNFRLDAQTEAALGALPETFAQVAWERKQAELEKLLVGPSVRVALNLLENTGLLKLMMPELVGGDDESLAGLEALPRDPWLRFAGWGVARGLSGAQLEALATRLKASRRARRAVAAWSAAFVATQDTVPDGVEFRRWLAGFGVEALAGAVELLLAFGRVTPAWATRARRRLRNPPPYRVDDLALDGRDLLALGFRGAELGRAQRRLLDLVLEAPQRNRREFLLKAAHSLSTAASVHER